MGPNQNFLSDAPHLRAQRLAASPHINRGARHTATAGHHAGGNFDDCHYANGEVLDCAAVATAADSTHADGELALPGGV